MPIHETQFNSYKFMHEYPENIFMNKNNQISLNFRPRLTMHESLML